MSLVLGDSRVVSRQHRHPTLGCHWQDPGKQHSLPSISNFPSAAIYPCRLGFMCYYLDYFQDLITFFIHREVRFIYWRSIKGSIMATLLIRSTLYVDRQPTLSDLLSRYAFWGQFWKFTTCSISLPFLASPWVPISPSFCTGVRATLFSSVCPLSLQTALWCLYPLNLCENLAGCRRKSILTLAASWSQAL